MADLDLLPRIRWDTGLAAAWTPGEEGAERALELFLDQALAGYAESMTCHLGDFTSYAALRNEIRDVEKEAAKAARTARAAIRRAKTRAKAERERLEKLSG